MKQTLLIAALCVGVLSVAGCGSDNAQPEPKKDDFKKTAPPANWRGPGQPGGPGGAPAAGQPGGQGGPPAGSGPISVPDNIKNGGQ